MKLNKPRKSLAALAIVASTAAYFVHTDRSPPPPREAQRQNVRALPVAPDPLPFWLVTRLQRVPPAGARNLFEFVAPHMAPKPHHTPTSDSIADIATSIGAATVKERLPDLAFYGYIATHARPLRAFFSHGDEIYIKSEGDLIAGRYKVIHIDATTAVVEDTFVYRRHAATP